MKIGIVADIHEQVELLRRALSLLEAAGVDRIITLGDVCDHCAHLGETVALLASAGVTGVWGNHELGLAHQPDEQMRRRYGGPILDYLTSLQARLEIQDCLFSHGLPCYPATDPVAYYTSGFPEEPEMVAGSLAAVPQRVIFVGHFHRWLATGLDGPLEWLGREPLVLAPPRRYLVVIGAVANGWCAWYDTDSAVLTPCPLL